MLLTRKWMILEHPDQSRPILLNSVLVTILISNPETEVRAKRKGQARCRPPEHYKMAPFPPASRRVFSRSILLITGIRQIHASGAAWSRRKPSASAAPVLIPGHATAEATADYFKHTGFPHLTLSGNAANGVAVSRLGFGTHRVTGLPNELDAMSLALRGGINVIDTSTAFEQSMSEKAVGKTLSKLLGSATPLTSELTQKPASAPPSLSRSHLVLLSKCGPIPPSLLSDLPPDIPSYALPTGSRHSIDPTFISWAIDRSRKNMGVETVDFYGLDGVEMLFKTGLREKSVWDLLESAIGFLEEEAKAGKRIKGWFFSSSTVAQGSPIALQKVLDFVRGISGDSSRLVGVEYPSNIHERTPELDVQLSSNGLWRLANRPLICITGSGKIAHLSSGPDSVKHWLSGNPDPMPVPEIDLAPILENISTHEELLNTLDPGSALAWSTLVTDNLDQLSGNYLACRAWLDRTFLPGVKESLSTFLDEGKPNASDILTDSELEELADDAEALAKSLRALLLQELPPLLLSVSRRSNILSNSGAAAQIHSVLSAEQRAARRGEYGMQGLAIEHAMRGGGTVLVGMRDPAYVRFSAEACRLAAERGIDDAVWKKVEGGLLE